MLLLLLLLLLLTLSAGQLDALDPLDDAGCSVWVMEELSWALVVKLNDDDVSTEIADVD